MIIIWLERLALLGSLSALVLALFWPHVGPKLFLPCIQKFLINPVSSAILNRQFINKDENQGRKQGAVKEHPKFSGGSLRRMTSDKESIHSTFRSLEGFGQSSLASSPSFAMRIVPTGGGGGGGGGHLNHRHLSQQAGRGGGGQSSTMSLTLFTATMMALIVYTLMKMLTSRFSRYNNNIDSPRRVNRRDLASCWSGPRDHYSRAGKETRDLRQDKGRGFARMNRDERARELILHHGGRNVSSAIRFLVGELEKQKHLLFKNLSDDTNNNNNLTCNCSCHTNDAYTDSTKPIFCESYKSLDLERLSDTGGCELQQQKCPAGQTDTIGPQSE